MKSVFEKIIEKLEEMIHPKQLYFCKYARGGCKHLDNDDKDCMECVVENAIEIVKQEAEKYDNAWISCSDRLPEEAFGCLVTVIDCNPVTLTEFENILPYVVGYDGDGWNDADGETIPFEVIAWQPLPQPYQQMGE